MAQRKRIALTYYYTENWIAGSYYVVNIIKALNTLDDAQKPELIMLLLNDDGAGLLREVGYPYIRFVHINPNFDGFFRKYARRAQIKFFKKDFLFRKSLSGVDDIFEGSDQFPFIKNHYFWVHDFQECRMPGFFTEKDAADRSALPKKVARLKDATLILSSYDALNDFNTFFPDSVCRVKVLRFASSLPDFSDVDPNEYKQKFDISLPYFICSNQFWQHKNHRVILEAIKKLREENPRFQVVFTGKNYDHRNPGYFSELTKMVEEDHLGIHVRFLGFIDRKAQLCLAKNSLGYIQPSLFEGWSTTVEDAKCLNQYIILSDIPVHREQLAYNVSFFNPYDPTDLKNKMSEVIDGKTSIGAVDYRQNIRTFGKDLIDAFS